MRFELGFGLGLACPHVQRKPNQREKYVRMDHNISLKTRQKIMYLKAISSLTPGFVTLGSQSMLKKPFSSWNNHGERIIFALHFEENIYCL